MKKLNQEDLKRKKAIEDFLEERTSINSEKSLEELIEASSIIKQLNDFIDSKLELSSKEIESKIKRLISHLSFS
jgi:replicative DNA helicase